MAKIKVMIDGVEITAPLNDAKIIVEGEDFELHFTFTDEGQIIDSIVDGEVDNTTSAEYAETLDSIEEQGYNWKNA